MRVRTELRESTWLQPRRPPSASGFKTGEHIVYPAHGVGKIVGIETQEVAGIKLDLFVISFVKDKMTLRVPTTKATAVGMRKLADAPTVKQALETVRGRARIKRTMWSRRAQEYEAKINSGDLISIAEVVRDLFRSETQPEQSYTERQLYEAALDRMSREIASVNKISETEAIRQIEQNLAKSPRRGAKPEGEAKGRRQGRLTGHAPSLRISRRRPAEQTGRLLSFSGLIDRELQRSQSLSPDCVHRRAAVQALEFRSSGDSSGGP